MFSIYSKVFYSQLSDLNLAPEEEKNPNNMHLEKDVAEGKDAKELYDKLGKINFSKAQYDFIVSLIDYGMPEG